MTDEIIKSLRRKFEEIGITKALIIDDKIEIDENSLILEILEDTYNKDFDIVAEMNKLGYPDMEALKDQVADDETPQEVRELLLENFSEKFVSNLNPLKELLRDIFQENITFRDSIFMNEDGKIFTFQSDTILFLDYQLEDGDSTKSEMYANFLSKNNTSPIPRCIIFISNKKDFSINSPESQIVDMLKPRDKSRYFSYIRSKQLEPNYRNSLYDYIHKKDLYNFGKAIQEITTIVENFSTGRLFYKLLDDMNKMLHHSSEHVLNKFRLLNARSLNEILSQKIAKEGEDESVFLTNWFSRLVAKTLIQSGTNLQDIGQSLRDITTLSNTHHELHEDVAIKDIINLEMWDLAVNERYSPIDFGDIFKIQYEDEELYAILLTQTCTLAVRGDSERAGKLGLLAIQTTKKKDTRPSVVSLEFADGNKINFDLDDNISIPLEVLDLTTTNNNGKAIIKRVNPVETQFPDNPYWSKGYKKRLKKQVNEILTKLSSSSNVVQIGRMWLPYTCSNEEGVETYTFKINRIARLDSTYSMNILQKMQSWWGRIGLPASVNFMNDYELKTGEITINGVTITDDFYVKYQFNSISDVAVSIDNIITAINRVFSGEDSKREFLEGFLQDNELTCLHYASSGLALMKLRGNGYKKVKNMFESKGISIELNTEDSFKLKIDVFDFNKIFLQKEDITNLVTSINLNSDNLFEFVIMKKTGMDSVIEVLSPFKIHDDETCITIVEDKERLSLVFQGKEIRLKVQSERNPFAATTIENKN